jgi:hypothetical protein
MIGGELLTDIMRLARELSRCGPEPVYVMAAPDWERVEVLCERDVVAVSVMQRAGWEIYAEFLHGERI